MKLAHAARMLALTALVASAAPVPRTVLSGAEVDDKAFITPDGRLMAMTDWSSGDIAIRDMSTGHITRLMAKPGGWESDGFADTIVLSPDLRQVAYVWHEGSNPGHLRIMHNQPGAKSRALVRNSEFPYVLPAGWSPDGKFVLVDMWKKDYTAQFAWVSVADGTFKVLRSLDWRRPGRPKLSPDGRTIAYSALVNQDAGQDSEDSRIYLLAADGSSEREIVHRSGVNEAPVWTPDGQRILFTTYRPADPATYDLWSVPVGRGEPSLIKSDVGKILPIGMTGSGSFYYVHQRGAENVFLASLDLAGKVQGPLVGLTENFAGSNRGPAWSPDGKFIAFKRRAEGNRIGYDLVIHSVETGAERTFSSNTISGNTMAGVPAPPLWLHDGSGLVLAMADRQERISFYRVDLNTGAFTQVLDPDTSYLSLAALSPDDKILYVTVRDEVRNTGGVASYNLATGDYGQVFSTSGVVNNFVLSPDGRILAIARSALDQGRWVGHLSVVAVDGSGFQDLYAADQDVFGGGPMLAWTQDARSILFAQGARDWQLMRIPVTGGLAEPLELVTTGPQHALTVSPDGARIAFSHGKTVIKETRVLENLVPTSSPSKPAASPETATRPLGLDVYQPVPETNPLTADKIALGRKLFFDKDLSRDGTLACAGCHDPAKAFSDGRPVARGAGGAEGVRNSPTLINRGYGRSFFWDGRAETLEKQALEPILNPKELALTQAELEQRTGLKTADVTAALASFVRTIRSGDSRFDHYMAGESGALSALEKTGLELFRGKGHCVTCHVGPNFTDEQFHNTGIAWRGDATSGSLADIGRERGAFKTPTLRELPRTAPYMHDGSFATLEQVVEYYSTGIRANPFLDREIRPRHFTAEEKLALVAFLRALSGKVQY